MFSAAGGEVPPLVRGEFSVAVTVLFFKHGTDMSGKLLKSEDPVSVCIDVCRVLLDEAAHGGADTARARVFVAGEFAVCVAVVAFEGTAGLGKELLQGDGSVVV